MALIATRPLQEKEETLKDVMETITEDLEKMGTEEWNKMQDDCFHLREDVTWNEMWEWEEKKKQEQNILVRPQEQSEPQVMPQGETLTEESNKEKQEQQERKEKEESKGQEERKNQAKNPRCRKCRRWGHRTPECPHISKHQLKELEMLMGAKVRKQKNKDFCEMVKKLNKMVPVPEKK